MWYTSCNGTHHFCNLAENSSEVRILDGEILVKRDQMDHIQDVAQKRLRITE